MRASELTTVVLALENRVNELSNKLENIIPIKERYYTFYCANCGNPFMLNENQKDSRTNHNRIFWCSSGHENVFKNNPLKL